MHLLLGTGHNNWSQNVVAPLGCIIQVCGSGTGVAHAEIVHMDARILGSMFFVCFSILN